MNMRNIKYKLLLLHIVAFSLPSESWQLNGSGVARVDQLPGHQVAFYKLNMKICRRDI